MLSLHIDLFSQNNPDAKGLYGVSFRYYDELWAVYSKDMATGEGAEDMTDVVHNLEEELAPGNANDEEEEEDMPFGDIQTFFWLNVIWLEEAEERVKRKEDCISDPLLDRFNEVSGDLKVVTNLVGRMAQTMDREAAN
jgi:hypothetical protein